METADTIELSGNAPRKEDNIIATPAKPFNDWYVDMSTFLGGMYIFAFTVSKPVHQPLIYAVGVQIVFILKFTEWA